MLKKNKKSSVTRATNVIK